MTTYKLVSQRCELIARARSSLHPVQASSSTLTGEIDAVIVDGALDLDQPASARIEVPLGSLRADNALVSREIQNRLDTRRFPTAAVTVSKVTGPVNGGYELHGELTLRHVTQPVTARAVLVSSDPRTLEVSGELTFDVRDFQLDPPKMLGLRVYPEVAVTVRIVAAADNDQTRS
jgi:polyisoprenoid-binding protein YceI